MGYEYNLSVIEHIAGTMRVGLQSVLRDLRWLDYPPVRENVLWEESAAVMREVRPFLDACDTGTSADSLQLISSGIAQLDLPFLYPLRTAIGKELDLWEWGDHELKNTEFTDTNEVRRFTLFYKAVRKRIGEREAELGIAFEQTLDPAYFGRGMKLTHYWVGRDLLEDFGEAFAAQRLSPSAEHNETLCAIERRIERLAQWLDACPTPERNRHPDNPWKTVSRLQSDSTVFMFLGREAVLQDNIQLHTALMEIWEPVPEDEVIESDHVPKSYKVDHLRRQLARGITFDIVRGMQRRMLQLTQAGETAARARQMVLDTARKAIGQCETLEKLGQYLLENGAYIPAES